MPRTRMHVDEVLTDVELVRRLVAGQFPQWAHLPVVQVESFGTDHDVHRLGDDLVVRLPRVPGALAQADKEARWLPVLGPRLPLSVPVQLAIGEPGYGYPYRWSVCKWLSGADASAATLDLDRAATELAAFVRALRHVATSGAPARPIDSRGGALAAHDRAVRAAIGELDDRVDAAAVGRAWQQALEAPRGDEPDVWLHADLLPGNLIVRGGRLTGVIDWGGLNVGDPACDLIAAWSLFTGTSRTRFRRELRVADAAWTRGRGWALVQALIALPYYWGTNPGMVRQALHAVHEVLSEPTD